MACVSQFLVVLSAVGFTVGPKGYAVLYLREPLRLGPIRFYGGAGGSGGEGSNAQCAIPFNSKSATGVGGNEEGSCKHSKEELFSERGRNSGDNAQKATTGTPIADGENADENLFITTSDNNGATTESGRFGGVYIGDADEAL